MPAHASREPLARPATLLHRLEFLGYRLAVGGLRMAPERLALPFGEAMGWLAGALFRVRWGTVTEHLRKAFPERDDRWRSRVAKASFRHLGRESVATFRLGKMGSHEIRTRTEVVGLAALQGAAAAGKGAIVVTGHFGNWEVGGAALAARGIPLDVVAQRQRNPLFDAELNRNRARMGMTVIERREAPRRVLRSLRAGRVVAIVGDQNVRRGGVFVDFFGRPASTARGTAIFALRTGCPIFMAVVRREPGLPQRYRVSLDPVEFTPTGDMEEDAVRLTAAHTRHLEAQIRRAPEQYFWQHRRWKTRPGEEEGNAGTDGQEVGPVS
jgi:Kdo2-lipid IVA lauroyltransferase/acyltransferase